jgi:hypothetical protein
MKHLSFLAVTLAAILATSTVVSSQEYSASASMPTQDPVDDGGISVTENVRTDCFLAVDGMFMLPGQAGVPELFYLEAVGSPDFGSVEFDLNTGELLYLPLAENSELDDVFNIYLYSPNSGNCVVKATYSPATQFVSFTAPAMPVVKNEIIIVINNGGPVIKTFSLDGHDIAGLLEVIRRFTEGHDVLGGVIRLNGVDSYFGDPGWIPVIVTPEVAEELSQKNANSDMDFLFGGGADLTEEERRIVFELGLAAADIGGILDPTPICDGVACVGELSQGNFVYAGINVVSMVPWLGDLAKAGKAGKFVRIVTEALEYAAKNPKFAERIRPLLELLSEALGKLPDGVAGAFDGLKNKVDDFVAKLAPKKRLTAKERRAHDHAREQARKEDKTPGGFDAQKVVDDTTKSRQNLDNALEQARIDPTPENLKKLQEAQDQYDGVKGIQDALNRRNRSGGQQ